MLNYQRVSTFAPNKNHPILSVLIYQPHGSHLGKNFNGNWLLFPWANLGRENLTSWSARAKILLSRRLRLLVITSKYHRHNCWKKNIYIYIYRYIYIYLPQETSKQEKGRTNPSSLLDTWCGFFPTWWHNHVSSPNKQWLKLLQSGASKRYVPWLVLPHLTIELLHRHKPNPQLLVN